MSEQPTAPEPGSALATTADTGVGSPGRPPRERQPLTGRAIIQAITEGSPAVITILAIFAALVVGALLIVLSDPTVLRAWDSFGYAPGAALSATWSSVSAAYSALFEGAIFSPGTISAAFHGGSIAAVFYPLSLTTFEATPLILTGLSVAVAFRAGMFNIGAAGQWIGGAVVAVWLGVDISLPLVLHAIVCVAGAFIGGAILGWIVGELKARTGAHEVILTIMLNYVMYNLLIYLLSHHSLLQAPHQPNQVAPNLPSSATLSHVGGPPPQVGVGFLIALAAAAVMWWLLSRSTVGFEFRTVGASPSAARSAGMNVERAWALAFLIAGGLAGLSGATIVQGQSQPLTFNSYGTYGFDGITVALLGRARPLGVVLAGLLFGALNGGGTLMEAATGVPSDVVDVIKGLIVLFVAAPPLIRLLFRLRRGGGPQAVTSKGWTP
jgi:general nucleoside transport system permease protein